MRDIPCETKGTCKLRNVRTALRRIPGLTRFIWGHSYAEIVFYGMRLVIRHPQESVPLVPSLNLGWIVFAVSPHMEIERWSASKDLNA